MNLIRKIFLFLLLLSSSRIYCQLSSSIDDIFIGDQYTFDPYIVPQEILEESAPEFNHNQLFFWLSQEKPEKETPTNLVLKLKDKRRSDFDFKLFGIQSFRVDDTTIIKPGGEFFFYFKSSYYQSKINEIYYYDGWTKGYFASVEIPTNYNPENKSYFDFFPIIGSTKKQNIFVDKYFGEKDSIAEYSFSGYKFLFHFKNTGEVGHYDEIIYESNLVVEYDNKEIFKFNSNMKFPYVIGDFNNNGLIDLFIYYGNFGRVYSFIEFTGKKYSEKSYYQESAD